VRNATSFIGSTLKRGTLVNPHRKIRLYEQLLHLTSVFDQGYDRNR
jgi:hypothetical protein